MAKPVRYQALYRALAGRLARTMPSVPSLPSVSGPVDSIRQDGAHLPQVTGRILVVEDSSVNREVARALLEQFGCSVEIAQNGHAALDATSLTPYDLVLMDCQMPEMDGFEATRRIRAREAEARPRTPRLTIIALTVNVLESDRRSCLAAGMDAYLSTPFTRRQLERLLARWLPHLERLPRGEM